jgi:peptide/nickel transport system permease protein
LTQASSTDRSFTTKKEFYAQFKKKSIAHELWLRFLKNKTAVIGLIIFSIIVTVALTAPLIADYNTVVIKINIAERLQPPSMKHWFGTDELGRDILARIVYGAQISLLIDRKSVV